MEKSSYEREKALTINVSVGVVESDIPSVTNTTMTVDPALSVGLHSSSQGCAAVSYTNTK